MNNSGDCIAIGALRNSDNGTQSGQVKIYSWDGINWIQKGQDLNGSANYDSFGKSVSLDSSGNILAVGAPYHSGNGIGSGQVKLFQWDGTTWNQLGSEINGDPASEISTQFLFCNKLPI